MNDFPGGKVKLGKRLDGAIRMEFGREVLVFNVAKAIEIAQALLKLAGVEMIVAEPGQTVIRPLRKINS